MAMKLNTRYLTVSYTHLRDDDGHALLGFGDRQLGAVEAVVLLGDRVEDVYKRQAL